MAQDVTWDTNETTDVKLSEFKEITTLLRKHVKDKRRIKYTCFDVSINYIALGSTSGSIYLFARDTCSFQQLVPLSNGAVTHVAISPDEKAIALSTVDGNVCLVVFKPSVKEAVTSTKDERNGEFITTLCWNDNSSELYIGDSNGTVHVMGLSIFTVKRGIFQDPACPIMGLNYRIVQMDFCSPLLLISTMSNCYICDTIAGQYEKVGLRTRQGEFGACFHKPTSNKESDVKQRKHPIGGNNEITESPTATSCKQYPRIYCARPGSRLWEANPNGKIVKTHNFKEALAIPPSVVHKPHVARPNSVIDSTKNVWPPQSLKFSPLCIIADEYLFTYNPNSLYILDPVNSAVILWSNEYEDITAANVIQNYIYLMTESGEFHCLELISNNLSMSNQNTYSSKLDSGIVVVNPKNVKLKKSVHKEEISETARQDESRNSSSDEFNGEVRNFDIEALNRQNLVQNDAQVKENSETLDRLSLDIRYIYEDEDEQVYSSQQSMSTDRSVETKEVKPAKDESSHLRSDVEIIYSLANSINNSMSDDEIDTIIQTVQELLTGLKNSFETLSEPEPHIFNAIERAEQYYRNIFLSKITKNRLSRTQSKCILNETISSFIRINMSDSTECECGFPHPSRVLKEPKYLDLGTAILNKYANESRNTCIRLCKNVPYMWRIYVAIHGKQEDFYDERIFAQCLQTRDDLILSFILLSLNATQWEFVMKAASNLSLKLCLLCKRPINDNYSQHNLSINWNNVANEMMKREGPDAAMKFLTKISTFVPLFHHNKSLFQSLIFTKILNHHGFKQPVDFHQKLDQTAYDQYSALCCPKVHNQLLHALEKDLNRPMSRDVFGTRAHHWGMRHEPTDSICPCCTLPLKTPVLLDNNGLSLFPCGHSYHVNCLIQKKILKCTLHL